MLSDEERKRLENRESLKPEIRAVNDYRVKKKLMKWLEDAKDALDIIHSPVSSRLKEDLSDVDVYRLLTISELIMGVREFTPVTGNALESEKWTAEGYDRPVNSTDIARSILLDEHITLLKSFLGENNPVPDAVAYAKITEDPKWKTRFSEEERANAKASGERLISSMDEYNKILSKKSQEP